MTTVATPLGQSAQNPLSDKSSLTASTTPPFSQSGNAPLDSAAQFVAEQGWSQDALALAETELSQSDPIAAAHLKSEVAMTLFKNEFGRLAQDSTAFHHLLQQTYGEKYNAGVAETLRSRTLQGDLSYLPDIEFVDPSVLGGNRGAYSQAEHAIYLNAQLPPLEMALTYLEEAGHHIDSLMGPEDAAGDEGEVFQRLLMGEDPASVALSRAKGENDHGIIRNGEKTITVEFRGIKGFFSHLDDQRRDIGRKIEDGLKDIGHKIDDWLHEVGRDIEDGFKKYLDANGGSLTIGVDSSGELNNIGIVIGNNQINFDPRRTEDDRIEIDWEAIRGGRQNAGDNGFYGVNDEVFIENAYAFLLGRRPDPAGQTDYITRLADGASQQEILAEIYQSEEAANLRESGLNTELLYYLTEQASDNLVAEALGSDYLAIKNSPLLNRNTPDETWLSLAFTNVLGRDIDEQGKAYYLEQLRATPLEAKTAILQDLWDSGESINRRLNRLTVLAETMDPLFALVGDGLSPTERSAIVVKEGYQEELRTLLNESRKAFMKSTYTPIKQGELENMYRIITETTQLSDDLRKMTAKRDELESLKKAEPFYLDALDDLYGSLRPGARELLGVQDSLEHQMQDLDQDIALLVAEIQHNNIGIAIQLTGNVRIIPENYLGFDEINNHDRIEQGNQILRTAGKAITFLEHQQDFLSNLVQNSDRLIAGAELAGELLKNRPAAKELSDLLLNRGSQANTIANKILEPIDSFLTPIQDVKSVSDIAENLFDAYIQGGLPKEVIQQALEMPEGDTAAARMALGQQAGRVAALFSAIGNELDKYALSKVGLSPEQVEEAQSTADWINAKAAQWNE